MSWVVMTEALVNHEMLRWARERVGLPPGEIAKAIGVAEVRVLAFERGEARPTFRQAEKWAAKTYIPFGFLYLDRPPEDTLPIPDLRRVGDGGVEPLSADFYDLLQDVLYKHGWYREYLQELGVPRVTFVGSYKPNAPIENLAGQIRMRTGLSLLRKGRDDEKLRQWFRGCEKCGIWILRSGIVGSNTRRPLRVKEFRGFAIADRVAPLVFINGRDAKAAQFFTLAHELTHIWLGESGISNPSLAERPTRQGHALERYCNEVAAEVLAPAEEFRRTWQRGHSLEENVLELTGHFPASRVVLARRAADLGLIDWAAYAEFYKEEKRSWDKLAAEGGNFYKNVGPRNGRRFVESVLNEAVSGRLLLREAGRLLGMGPEKVVELHRRAAGGEGHAPA